MDGHSIIIHFSITLLDHDSRCSRGLFCFFLVVHEGGQKLFRSVVLTSSAQQKSKLLRTPRVRPSLGESLCLSAERLAAPLIKIQSRESTLSHIQHMYTLDFYIIYRLWGLWLNSKHHYDLSEDHIGRCLQDYNGNVLSGAVQLALVNINQYLESLKVQISEVTAC